MASRAGGERLDLWPGSAASVLKLRTLAFQLLCGEHLNASLDQDAAGTPGHIHREGHVTGFGTGK